MCTFAVLFDSVPFFALSLEGRPGRGELPFPVAFNRCLIPSSDAGLAAFAARRCCPQVWVNQRRESGPTFEAQSHGFRNSLSTLRSLPPAAAVVGSRKTRFRLVANLCRFQGSNKVSINFIYIDFLLSRLCLSQTHLGM